MTEQVCWSAGRGIELRRSGIRAYQRVRVHEHHRVRVEHKHALAHSEEPRRVVVAQQPQPAHRVAPVEGRRRRQAVGPLRLAARRGRVRGVGRRSDPRQQRGALQSERVGGRLAARARAARVGSERLREALEQRAPHHRGRTVPPHMLDELSIVAEQNVVVQPQPLELSDQVECQVELACVAWSRAEALSESV